MEVPLSDYPCPAVFPDKDDKALPPCSRLRHATPEFVQMLETPSSCRLAPDDAVLARFSLMLAAGGNVRTRTLKAFPELAYREIITSLG